jgi:hypothetical protein
MNPKLIQDPDDPTKMIANPDYDPTKNEDGSPIKEEPKTETPAEIEARLKADFKTRMDALDKKLKDEQTRVAEYERKEREAETQRLKDAGKLEEAHQRELEDRDAKMRDLENRNTELTRDREVEKLLRGTEFRNARSEDMASRDIISNLVKNESGEWVAKNGKSLTDYVSEFLADEDNAFLLKSKRSTGLNADEVVIDAPNADKKDGSIFSRPLASVLKDAEAGKLPHQQKR